jgi:hypothetical protein
MTCVLSAYIVDIMTFAPESIRRKKKVSLHSTFYVGSGIRDKKYVWIRDPG